MTRPITAREIGEQSATRPLGKFGSQSVRYPVREGRDEAERGDAVAGIVELERIGL